MQIIKKNVAQNLHSKKTVVNYNQVHERLKTLQRKKNQLCMRQPFNPLTLCQLPPLRSDLSFTSKLPCLKTRS